MPLKDELTNIVLKTVSAVAYISPALERRIGAMAINYAVTRAPSRPHALCTGWPYLCWDGLTDRTNSGRHLPQADAGYVPSLPPIDDVARLFVRPPGGGKLSRTSTQLFGNFAQWFTDGFLRTDASDILKNTSNHEIDLSTLYGRTKTIADALREGKKVGKNLWVGGRGRLKSQRLSGGAEFPPFFFDQQKYDQVLATHPKLKPSYDDPNLSAADRIELKASWKSLLQQIVAPEFASLIDEQWILEHERKILMSDPARIKNRFAMGVERANNQFGYVAFNVLFLREHNRLCALLETKHPDWDGERLYQTARNTVIVMLIKIVIEEYINHITQNPIKLRADPRPFYKKSWYRTNWMTVEFNLLYRWHSLSPDKVRVDKSEYSIDDIIFNNAITVNHGIARIFDSFSRNPAWQIGLLNTPANLAQWAEAGSVVLGRKANLMPYNAYRKYCGLKEAKSFADISSDITIQEQLKKLYGEPGRVEYVVGLFAEDVGHDSVLPELVGRLVAIDAFSQALTNPLLSEHVYKPETFAEGWDEIAKTNSLKDVVYRNIPENEGNPKPLVTMNLKGG